MFGYVCHIRALTSSRNRLAIRYFTDLGQRYKAAALSNEHGCFANSEYPCAFAHDVNIIGRLTMDREETTEEKKSRLLRTAGRRKSKVTGPSMRRKSKVTGTSAVESRKSQGRRSVRLRLLHAILMLLSAMLLSGCVRIAAELNCKPTDCYAEDRIYMGIEHSSTA